MRIGTKSVLIGAHCFFIHPFFVALGWWKLFGFPFDPRLWIAFFVHDIGYWGKPNMDGPEGEDHPLFGARLMHRLFDRDRWRPSDLEATERVINWYWHDLCLYHSRFLARRMGQPPSMLCYADKMAMCLEPNWFYLPRVKLTGEINEYMHVNPREVEGKDKSPDEWFTEAKTYMRNWLTENSAGKPDTWTQRRTHE